MRPVALVFRFMHIIGSAFSECFRVFALIHDLLRIEICSRGMRLRSAGDLSGLLQRSNRFTAPGLNVFGWVSVCGGNEG